MNFKSFSYLLLTTFLLTGCISNEPLSFNQLGNFSAYPLNNHIFRISYQANENIGFNAAQNITLVKAAQTTVLNGYQYFTIMAGPTNVHRTPQKQVVYNDVWAGPGWGPGWGYPGWGSPYYTMPEVVTTGNAEIAYNIKCYSNQQDAPTDAYNAKLILENLGMQYGVSPTGQVLMSQPNKK